jgi:CheY-like chemotaxis protein
MSETYSPIRVLVVDDEPEVRDAYRQIFLENEVTQEMVGFRELRSRLFKKNPADTARERSPARNAGFEPVFCDGANAAVTCVKEGLARNQPFAVVFLDMRMPPGPDGAWAAMQFVELDPAVEIFI